MDEIDDSNTIPIFFLDLFSYFVSSVALLATVLVFAFFHQLRNTPGILIY